MSKIVKKLISQQQNNSERLIAFYNTESRNTKGRGQLRVK